MNELKAMTDSNLRAADAELAKWTAKLAKDPMHAFEWSEDAFKAAARKRVWLEIEAWSARATIAQIKDELTKQCLRAARYPEASTSFSGNAMRTYYHAAQAAALEELGYLN